MTTPSASLSKLTPGGTYVVVVCAQTKNGSTAQGLSKQVATLTMATDGLDFGGAYGFLNGGTPVTNPLTNAQTCPAGYLSSQFRFTPNVDWSGFFCYRRSAEGVEPALDFGGMYGLVDNVMSPNPLAGKAGCPAGFNDAGLEYANNVDAPLNYCYRVHTTGSKGPFVFGGIYGRIDGTDTLNPATGDSTCAPGFTKAKVHGNAGGYSDAPIFMCYKVYVGNPINLTVAADPNSASTLNVSWGAGDSNAAAYIVSYLTGPTPPESCDGGPNVGAVTTYKLTNLAPGATYSVRVCAVNSVQTRSNGVVASGQAGLAAPKNLVITADAPGQLKATWTPGDASNTSYYVALVQGTAAPACSTGVRVDAQTTYTRSDLLPNTLYTIAVCAYSSSGQTSASASASQTTSPVSPPVPKPTGFSIVADAPSQLTASWTSGGGTTAGFWIAYSASTTPPLCTGGIKIGLATSRSRNDFGSGKTFSISVCAYDAAGNVSEPVSGTQTTLTATGTPPPAPTNMAIAVDSQSQFTITWTSGGGSTAGFYLAFGGGTATPVCSNGIQLGNVTTYTRSDLSPSNTYTVSICARDANDVISTGIKATATTSPAAINVPTPTGFTVAADAPGQLTASWTSGGGSTVGYWVALAPSGASPVCTGGIKVNSTTYSRTDLGASKSYTIAVCARDADGGISNTVAATTTTMAATGTPPPAPTNMVLTANSASKATVSWTSGGGTTAGFYAAFGLGSAVPNCSNGIKLGDKTTYSRTDLSPLSKYTVAICAYDATENTSTPISATVTTPAAVESVPAPTGFAIVADLPAQLTASWTSGGGGTVGYWIAFSANSTPPLCTGGIQVTRTSYTRVLASNQTFSIAVCAYDADGNLSSPVSGTKTTN